MGFFNRLINGAINKAVGNAIDQSLNQHNQSGHAQPTYTNHVNQYQPMYDTMPNGNIRDKDYFRSIISTEYYSRYTIRENIPVSEFGGEGKAYDFGLYEGGQLKALITLIDKGKYRTMPFWNSEKKANELGIPFIYYFLNQTNPPEIVISRIEKFMRR